MSLNLKATGARPLPSRNPSAPPGWKHPHDDFTAILDNASGRIDMRRVADEPGITQLYLPRHTIKLDAAESVTLAIAILDYSGTTELVDNMIDSAGLLARIKYLECELAFLQRASAPQSP